MSKVRILYRQDGGVSVIHPALESRRVILEDGTIHSQDDIHLENLDRLGISYTLEPEEQWLKRVFDKATPDGTEYDDIDKSELPQTREDREAWEGEKGKGVKVNKTKAAEMKAEKVRREKIKKEKDRILEEMAIAKLQERGEL